MRHAQLTSLDLPDFGSPMTEPELHRDIYAARLKQLFARMAASSLDALVIYGDREHVANISWATGYDPRFEEAICIIVPGRTPTLLAGNEGFPYAEMANGSFERVLVAAAEPHGPAPRQIPRSRQHPARVRHEERHAHRPCRMERL